MRGIVNDRFGQCVKFPNVQIVAAYLISRVGDCFREPHTSSFRDTSTPAKFDAHLRRDDGFGFGFGFGFSFGFGFGFGTGPGLSPAARHAGHFAKTSGVASPPSTLASFSSQR